MQALMSLWGQKGSCRARECAMMGLAKSLWPPGSHHSEGCTGLCLRLTSVAWAEAGAAGGHSPLTFGARPSPSVSLRRSNMTQQGPLTARMHTASLKPLCNPGTISGWLPHPEEAATTLKPLWMSAGQ